MVCFAARHLSIYLCVNVGARGATRRSAWPVLRHSESGPLGLSARIWGRRVCQWSDCLPRSSHTPPVSVLTSPVPVSAPPTGLEVCFFFIYLVSDFLAIQFSVSSGCARKRSVSTYSSILTHIMDILITFFKSMRMGSLSNCVL